VTAGALVTRADFAPTKVFAQAKPGAKADGIKALVCDVFGTCVDWRNGVARDAERILKPLGYTIDGLAFADAWRALDQIRPQFGFGKTRQEGRRRSQPGLASPRYVTGEAAPRVSVDFAAKSMEDLASQLGV
jgi:hypothetical protein